MHNLQLFCEQNVNIMDSSCEEFLVQFCTLKNVQYNGDKFTYTNETTFSNIQEDIKSINSIYDKAPLCLQNKINELNKKFFNEKNIEFINSQIK